MQETVRLLSRLFRERRLTLSVAESVTAGYIQYLCSGAPDASSFFQGGITVYNCAQKFRHLHVEPIYALEQEGVSAVISQTLARNCCRLFGSEVGLGITGFADRQSSSEREVFAFLSVFLNGEEIVAEKLFSDEASFSDVQIDFARHSLRLLTQALKV